MLENGPKGISVPFSGPKRGILERQPFETIADRGSVSNEYHLDPRIKSAEGLWKIILWTIFKPNHFS